MGGAKFHYLGSSFMHKKNTTISTHAPRISARYSGHEIKNHVNKKRALSILRTSRKLRLLDMQSVCIPGSHTLKGTTLQLYLHVP